MVVAQLVEQLLPKAEIGGLKLDSSNFIYYQLHLNCVEKTKLKKKRLGMVQLKRCTKPIAKKLIDDKK